MRKIAAGLLTVGVLLIGAAPAMATKPDSDSILVNGHKVYICHNVSHNPHVILVDVASVDANNGDLKGGHGVWPAPQNDVSTFVPHDSGGHDQDFLFLSDAEDPECPVVETTTTTQPEVTTTTVPEVTTTTQPAVTTTTAPVVITTEPTVVTTTPTSVRSTDPVVEPATVQPGTDVLGVEFAQPAPVAELPHTGAASTALALVGTGLGLTGLVLLLFGALIKRRTVQV